MDPSLKLFGKTIQLPGNPVTATEVAVEPGGKASAPPSETQECSSSAAASSEDKCKEKPDKILECPRCNSMDTKFCYFNNYNVNQPRYFCKNCQRYWTSGGTMRNVPFGAGRRRKINNFTSPHHHRTVKILAEKTAANCSQNGLHNHKPEELGVPVSPAAPYWGFYHLPLVTPTVAFQNPTNLGKHSRDDNKCLWFPKTLRIDELAVAAKSSIWATLGIMQNDRVESMGGGALKAFKKCHVSKILTMNFPMLVLHKHISASSDDCKAFMRHF